MNIFLPYDGIEESVGSLDDLRLNKQILECYQIHQVANGGSQGYAKHPIVKHYIQYPRFVARYGYQCCLEYLNRKGIKHKYFEYFNEYRAVPIGPEVYPFKVFYAEGSINDPNCIRTYNSSEVYRLYKQKLINKWQSDIDKGRPPRWTASKPPEFWTEYLNMQDDLK